MGDPRLKYVVWLGLIHVVRQRQTLTEKMECGSQPADISLIDRR